MGWGWSREHQRYDGALQLRVPVSSTDKEPAVREARELAGRRDLRPRPRKGLFHKRGPWGQPQETCLGSWGLGVGGQGPRASSLTPQGASRRQPMAGS